MTTTMSTRANTYLIALMREEFVAILLEIFVLMTDKLADNLRSVASILIVSHSERSRSWTR